MQIPDGLELNLPHGQIFVGDEGQDSDMEGNESVDSEKDVDVLVSEEDIDEGEETMHMVTFKCVGSVHDSKAQEVLAEVRHSKAEDSTPVCVEEEPRTK